MIGSHRHTTAIAWGCAGALHCALAVAIMAQVLSGGTIRGRIGPGQRPLLAISLAAMPSTSQASAPGMSHSDSEAAAPRPEFKPATETAPVVTPAKSSATSRQPSSANATSLTPEATTAINDSAIQLYLQQLLDHLQAYRRYPVEARRNHVQGTVILHFVLDRDGKVDQAWIVQSSGSSALDNEALAAISRALPLPAIPENLPSTLNIDLPVAFSLS